MLVQPTFFMRDANAKVGKTKYAKGFNAKGRNNHAKIWNENPRNANMQLFWNKYEITIGLPVGKG